MNDMREIDIEVAERVMGWKRETTMLHGKEQLCFIDPEGNKRSIECGCAEDFNPSVNLAQAWEAWEAIRKTGRWCCLDIHSDYHYYYEVRLTPHSYGLTEETHMPTVKEQVDTKEELPLAICKAALRAVASN